MRKTAWFGITIGALFLMALPSIASAQTEITLEEIFNKNLQASGGREKLLQVQNISFRTGGTKCVSASSGELKLIRGKEPVVTDIILVIGGKVQKNSFNEISEIIGLQKAVYEALAKLYAGVFSLLRFEGQLEFEGVKAYGPEKFFHLVTDSGPLKVAFFLRTEDFFLRRLVFQGVTPEGDKYEVNYDFAPFEETDGLMIPVSWFSSQVGTRGSMEEVTEVKTNQLLEEDFFAKLDVNIGTIEAALGRLKGNILDFSSSPYGLTISTNWRKTDIEKAGFQTGDKLAFLVDGVETELTFYASPRELPSQNVLAQGARLMLPPRQGDMYVIQFFAVDMGQIMSKLKPLAAIAINKK